ncbi:MAG: hypothetical protein ACKO7R_16950 [Pseudanabaena sp.]
MNTHKQIQQIAATDELLDQAIAITPIRKPKDRNHLQRRQQQRAITNEMMQIAIAYGQQRSDRHGAIVYTLGDRQLKTSPYAKFTDTLRGLQVICLQDLQTLQILTTYWNFDSKRKARI